jgi:DNA-binding transcriptional ArsR family regulator
LPEDAGGSMRGAGSPSAADSPVPRIENKARDNMAAEPIPGDESIGSARLSKVPRLQEEAILAALGDPQSRALLLQLNETTRSAQELVERSGMPQASVYRKLRELQESGLVGIQRSALSTDGHRTDLFRSRLAEARLAFRADRLEVWASFRELAAERLVELWEEVRSAKKR